MNLKKVLGFIIVIVLFIFCYSLISRNDSLPSKVTESEIQHVKVGGQMIKVDLALTPEDQKLGLSGREYIAEDEGMLFVFKKPDKNYFWMKEMNFPIDIIWLDEDLKVIFIQENALPESFPASFGPEEESRYVLELSSGFVKKNNLEVGNFVKFLP